jgi:phage shock protein A|nr:MAG: membrane protein [Bacteroidota bacterium]
MWQRFVRALKALLGGLIKSLEDPRLILEQNIRELNDQIPKMNENIATVKANVLLLEREIRRLEGEVQSLTSHIRAALEAGREDVAENYAIRLEQQRAALDRAREQLRLAQQAYEKAIEVKKAFMRERERKIREAQEALREHERARWQARVADALESFEVAGIDQTHQEMVARIREEAARQEARMEMALDSVDRERMRIEEEAERIRAREVLKQFKLEMGLESGSSAPEAASSGEVKQVPETQKTVGRTRSRS